MANPTLAIDVASAPGSGLVVGLSGGLDSLVLAHALAQSPAARMRGLRALHVHHGLHPDADSWAGLCEAFCALHAIPLTIAHVTVVPAGDGLEAAARRARHEAFAAQMQDDETLVLAHHRDDQAETFLLRALRASGPDGLAAMRPLRPFARGWLWRPLLDVPRAALQAYAGAHGIAWIDDPANDALVHDRNFLRHRVLPLLRERWPHAEAALARSAVLNAEAAELLADEDRRVLDSARTDAPDVLALDVLRAHPAARRARVLRRWIAELDLPPLPAEGIARFEDDLADGAPDADFAFEWAGATLRRWRQRLRAARRRDPFPADWTDTWDGRVPLILPDGGTLTLLGAPAFDAPLHVRLRAGGERIVLPGRPHSHSLKHALQDAGIPPWERECLPLLLDADGTVLAVGDRLLAASLDAWLRTHGARLQWSPPPSH